MKKFLCLLLAVIIGCFVFAGCGNDKKDSGKESDPKNKTSSSDKGGDLTSTPDKDTDDKGGEDDKNPTPDTPSGGESGGDSNPSGGNSGSGNEPSGGNGDNSGDDDLLGSGVELPDDVWE